MVTNGSLSLSLFSHILNLFFNIYGKECNKISLVFSISSNKHFLHFYDTIYIFNIPITYILLAIFIIHLSILCMLYA